MKDQERAIVIVGAGLTGSLLALSLSQLGYKDIHVYEKRSATFVNDGSKRTIAMSISERGWQALKMVGLYEEVYSHTTPTYGRISYHPVSGSSKQYYGRPPQAIYTISRSFLNNLLVRKAEATKRVFFHFNSTLEDLDLTSKTVTFSDRNGKKLAKQYDHLFGADGVFSAVRNILQRDGHLSAQQKKLDLGYKEMVIPYRHDILEHMSTEYVHVYSADNSVLVVLPSDHERQFVANLYAPTEQTFALEFLPKSKLKTYFEDHFMPLYGYAPTILDQYITNPMANMFTVSCSRWNYQDQVLLIGDAVHAIAPFYAMGMNLCFEDCVEFQRLLQVNDMSIGATISAFEQARRPDTDAMAQMALENYDNLHKSHRYEEYQIWELERKLWEEGAVDWSPEYVSVAFTTHPLRKILQARDERRVSLQALLSL